jgi:hypothetical protein
MSSGGHIADMVGKMKANAALLKKHQPYFKRKHDFLRVYKREAIDHKKATKEQLAKLKTILRKERRKEVKNAIKALFVSLVILLILFFGILYGIKCWIAFFS